MTSKENEKINSCAESDVDANDRLSSLLGANVEGGNGENESLAMVFGEDYSDYRKDGLYLANSGDDVWCKQDKSTLIYGINANKKIVLGDSASFTILDGLNLDINLSVGPDQIEKNGKEKPETGARISLSGITKKIVIGAEHLATTSLPPNEGDVRDNCVLFPRFKALALAYGILNSATENRLLGVEFMASEGEPNPIDLKQSAYANFRLITKEAISKKDLKNLRLMPKVSTEDDSFQAYIDGDDGKGKRHGDKYEPVTDWNSEIKLTTMLENDPGISQGMGANIVQYQHGLGRVSYEEMSGISKSIIYATDQYTGTYCKGAKFTLIFAPFSMETIHTINTTNSYARLFNTSSIFAAVDLATTIQLLKVTPSFVGVDMSQAFGVKLYTNVGPSIKTSIGLAVKNSTSELHKNFFQMVSTQLCLEDNVARVCKGKIDLIQNEIDINDKKIELHTCNTSLTAAVMNLFL